jgi:ABC-type lipoprotein release transport system permease subunit
LHSAVFDELHLFDTYILYNINNLIKIIKSIKKMVRISPDGGKIACGSSFDGSPINMYIDDLREELSSYSTIPIYIAVFFIVFVFSMAMYLKFLRK